MLASFLITVARNQAFPGTGSRLSGVNWDDGLPFGWRMARGNGKSGKVEPNDGGG
jgi:hypothetical protein